MVSNRPSPVPNVNAMLAFTEIPAQLRQDVFLDKDRTPQVITVREFDEPSVQNFNREFQQALQRQQPVILINIDSYGGNVYSLLSMLSTIRNSPVPVATYTQSKAMSCGAFLLGMGTVGYRYASPLAVIMLHDVSSAIGGKVNDIVVDGQETQALNDTLFQGLSTNCGWNEHYFQRKVHDKSHSDWYIRPPEAKKVKLIDTIGTPHLITRVRVETTLELV